MPLIAEVGGACPPWVAGCRVTIIDGHCIEANEHRLQELRTVQAGALPGKTLGVFDPAHGLVTAVFPCEDGHAQERALFSAVLETVAVHDLWMANRNCCTCGFLCGIATRQAGFLVRQHEGLPDAPCSPWRSSGRVETGQVSAQRIRGWDAQGPAQVFRCLRIKLDHPTRDGDHLRSLVTNVPRHLVSTKQVVRLYRKRWTLETAFQQLEAYFHAEIHTLGSPKAAIFGCCLAVVAYNMLAVVLAALRRVHGAEIVEQEVSSYDIAHEIAETSRGMMMAIPADAWRVCRTMSAAAMGATLLELAHTVRLRTVRTPPRGPKKPRPTREATPKQSHVCTAKLLTGRKANVVIPQKGWFPERLGLLALPRIAGSEKRKSPGA